MLRIMLQVWDVKSEHYVLSAGCLISALCSKFRMLNLSITFHLRDVEFEQYDSSAGCLI